MNTAKSTPFVIQKYYLSELHFCFHGSIIFMWMAVYHVALTNITPEEDDDDMELNPIETLLLISQRCHILFTSLPCTHPRRKNYISSK